MSITRRFLKSRSQGVFWIVLGLLLSVGALVKPEWFVLDLPWFPLPVGPLAIAYGLVNLVIYRNTRDRLHLSEDDLSRYGARLTEITPGILHHWEAGMPVKDIAARYEADKGIPSRVTLLYIIELLRDLQARREREKLVQIKD